MMLSKHKYGSRHAGKIYVTEWSKFYSVSPKSCGRDWFERGSVEASRGFWINCSVALHNFPE